jgi:glycosyltransferase involved in cell wall biosynthesis
MNLLVTASTFPRWRGDEVPDFVWQQVLALKRQYPSLNLHVLAPHDAGSKCNEDWEGIHIHRFRYFLPESLQRLVYPAIWPNIKLNPTLFLLVPFLLIFEFVATIRLLQKEDIALLYSHWFMPQGIACGLAAWILRVPHVLTSHSSDVQVMGKLPVLGPALVPFILKRCHAITVVSRRSREKMKWFFDGTAWEHLSARVKIIPMGVDLAEWSGDEFPLEQVGERLGVKDKQVLLFVGRLVEKKGLCFLLDALNHPDLKSRKDLLLIIAGTGPMREKLEEQVESLRLRDIVRFVGFIKGEQKREWFAVSSIVLVPSIITDAGDAEGFPVSLMEGLSAGKICVATDVSGADEILVDGANGYLVPQKSVAPLQQALLSALDQEPHERDHMSEKARQCARCFAIDQIAREHYEHLIEPIELATPTK